MRCAVLLAAVLPCAQAQVFFKPNPIPDNYVEWTAAAYEDSSGVSLYSSSTEHELVFWWESGTQDVWEMHDETAWKNCDFSYAVQLVNPLLSGGDYVEGAVALDALPAGTHYLACGVGTHCEAGQKLILSTWKDEFANEETGWNSYVGAGASNAAIGDWATVGGGYNNRATGLSSVVVGGISNAVISNYATIAGGYRNAATSRFATVLGGAKNTARGRFSLTAGYMAKTTEDYSASFGFNGEVCQSQLEKSVTFCADSFYLNDFNLLQMHGSRRLQQSTQQQQKTDLQEMTKTVDAHQATIDELQDLDSIQNQAFALLESIEGRLSQS